MLKRFLLMTIACLLAAVVVGMFGCAGMANPREEIELVDVDSEPLVGPFLVGGTYKKTPFKGYVGVSIVSEDGGRVRGFVGRVLIDSTEPLEPGDRIYLQLAVLERGGGEPSSPNYYRAIRAPG